MNDINARSDTDYDDGYFESGQLMGHYTDWNSSGPNPLIMLHGLAVQLHTWDPLSRVLSRTRRVVTPDLRGHGDSAWALDYWLDGFVGDLTALMDSLNLEKVDLLGHSLGARVVIAFAAQFPNRVDRLLLSDAGPTVTRSGTMEARHVSQAPFEQRGFRDEKAAEAFFRELHPEWKDEFIDLHVRHQVRPNWAGRLSFKADPELYWLLGSAGAREADRLWSDWEKITTDILLIRGSRSPFVDEELVTRMQEANDRMKVVTVESGHYVPREAPEAFIEAVENFLVAS
jgi:pimeloyl-ACP methyl ester carboxylesterase